MQRHHEKCVKKGCFGMGILKKSQNVIYWSIDFISPEGFGKGQVWPMPRGKIFIFHWNSWLAAWPEILIFLLKYWPENHHFSHWNIDLKNQYLILIFEPSKSRYWS
jgi:hypothetical protein